jgi:GH18 family chitinase
MKKIKAVQESMKTRISLSVGGGGRSDHFRVIAKSASLRTKFAAALGKFINEVDEPYTPNPRP